MSRRLTLSTRRGFTSRRAAVTERSRLVESIERGAVKPARERFDEFWLGYLEERRPYLTAGTLIDYETHGRKHRDRRSAAVALSGGATACGSRGSGRPQ